MTFIIKTPPSRAVHRRGCTTLESVPGGQSPTARADGRTGRVWGARVATLYSTARSRQEMRSNIDKRGTQCSRQRQIVCRLASRPSGFKHGARPYAESARVAAVADR
eukprot:1611874-Pleurochrysis_carterae.AAC.1